MIDIYSNSTTGAFPEDGLAELRKAIEMGYGTDVAGLTGGGALRIQSLDKTMQATVVENDHLTLFNRLQKMQIGATVDEWTEQSSIGGFLGGSTNTEAGVIAESQGQYDRRVGLVKYLQTRASVTMVASITTNIVDAVAIEQKNAALRLLQDANYLSYEGDDEVVPTEFSGIKAQLRAAITAGRVSPDHIIDLAGTPLNNIEPFTRAAAAVSSYENFGRPTDLFWPNSVQADVDAGLDPAFRVSLSGTGNDITLGAPVSKIRLSQGVVNCNTDIFIPDDRLKAPFEVKFGALATANDAFKPANAVAGTPVNDASSAFAAAHAGNYYYAVAGVNARGQSTVRVTAQVAVAAGQRVPITITASAGGTETGYAIYRSRRNGTNTVSDMRLITRIPRTGGTTTWDDLNRIIPGTTEAYMLDMRPSNTAIIWRQLLPMTRFSLYPTNQAVLPWAQLLFGYLRLSKLRHHAMFTNILPNGAQWRPF